LGIATREQATHNEVFLDRRLRKKQARGRLQAKFNQDIAREQP
jgi:hypothetical protein